MSRWGRQLPAGTRVLNINDGEAGTIIGPLDVLANVGVVSYVVESDSYGRELWPREQMLAFSELETGE